MKTAAALLLALALPLHAALGATTNTTTALCADATRVVLGACAACAADQPCAQFPSTAATACSEASRNTCASSGATCTYQCLNAAYNARVGKWTLFVKEPKASDTFTTSPVPIDPYPSALVDKVASGVFSSETKAIQITGFDDTRVQKGSVKTVAFDDNAFADVPVLSALVLINVDLSSVQTNLLPKSVSSLYLQNCNLQTLPTDIGAMSNLVELNLAKNEISELPTSGSTIASALQKVRTLDLSANAFKKFETVLPEVTSLNLGDNQLDAFPTVVFNMTKLTSINLKGHSFPSLVVTNDQFTFLRRLLSNSSLGVSAASGSCAPDATENRVLDSVVCVSNTANGGNGGDSGGGSSSTLIIVIVAVAAVLVLGIAGFFCYRRRSHSKNDDYYATTVTYANNNNTANNNTNPSNRTPNTRGSTANGRGRASSALTGPKGGPSFSTNGTTGDYAEIGRYASDMSRGAITTQETQHARELLRVNASVTRIDARDINFTRSIAKGAFGQVWLAHLNGGLVAVKKMLTNDPQNVSDFVAELNLLATLTHPRILGLVGACYDDALSDVQIVMEFMDAGDLLTVLRKHPPTELTWDNGKGTFCVQICEAVYYLHSLAKPLIHRDIKSRNILMDSHKGAKLSDFGESRERTFQQTMTAGVGTARWVAPEIILGEDYSELADIYSLGVLLTELDTHKIPYQDLGLEESTIVQQVAVGKLRPKVSDACPDVIRRLAHECLQSDPQLRPSAARVLQTLMSSTLARRPTTILEAE